MFGNLNKPAFGATAPNTSFGFGATSTASANPFGQSQLFGKPTTGTFGSPSTSTFGQPSNTSLFPSTQAQSTNLFQNANTTFGAPTSTPGGFGSSNLFGQQQASTSGLFNTSSTFGQQNKPPGFGFGTQSAQPSLFGQQPQPQQTSSIFQPSTSNLFGGTTGFVGQQAAGTVVKFNPVTGTDTMMKNGVAQSINTKHHSITCMKEYENRSFEELRFEDYLANRKGPQQQAGFGAPPFGAAATSAPSLFGQTDASKSAFGQTTGFGQTASTFGQNTSGFGLGNQQQQSGGLFGKPTGFGAPTSSTGTFGFGGTTQTANPFGATQAAKPFGSTMQPIFGTNTNTTQQSGFGTGLFGPTTTQNTAGSLFGKPTQPTTGFGAGQTSTGFSFGPPASTQTSSLFQPNKPLFGQTSTTGAFGQTNTFGATNATPFGSTFGKTTAPAFGTSQPSAFGTSMGGFQNTGTSLFGNTAAKPGGLFGNTGSTGLFGNTGTTFQPNAGFGLQQQQSLFPPPEQPAVSNLALLTSDPFGDAPHLLGLEPKIKTDSPSVSATDPKELKALLDPQKKVDLSHNSKLKVFPLKSVRDSLFEGLSPKFKEDGNNSPDYVKTNCRRLVLKQRPNMSGEGNSPGLMRTDILKHLFSPDENSNSENNRIESAVQNDLRTTPLRLTFDNTINETKNASVQSSTHKAVVHSVDKNTGPDHKSVYSAAFDDEEEPVNFAGGGDTSKTYPCGIVCTRPEYYTLPALEELGQYVDENGACIVKGFTIGRRGYGNVYFPDELDVAGLNIDELVHFRYREINVYPDDSKKPPVGQGLNRKAQVTLDNVYPRRADTNTLIKDVQELLQMNFAEKLRKITVKKGAKFVDFRPETGSWVFKVDHFSRYGFNDSDEEAEANDKEAQKKKNEEGKKVEGGAKEGGEVPPKVDQQKKKDDGGKEIQARLSMDMDIFVEDGDHFNPEDDLLPQSMYGDNVSEDDYHVVPQGVPLHLPYYDPSSRSTSRSIQIMKSTLFDDDRSSDAGSHIPVMKSYLDLTEDIRQLPVIREEVLPKKKTVLRPRVDKVYNFVGAEVAPSIIPSRTYMDLGMFKGKSFRVGWARGFDFFGPNADLDGNNAELCRNTIDIGVYSKDFDPLKEFLSDALEVVLEESACELDEKLIPTFQIRNGDSYLRKQAKLFSKLAAKYSAMESRYSYSIWTLAEALWGPGENTVSNRRHLLSEWLKLNTNYDDLATTTTTPKRLFNQLSVFKIPEAANLAMDEHMPSLSLIISQLSLTNSTKLFLQEQIEGWYTSMAANHISDDMKRIYLLLSGIPVKEGINVFEDVDWKRAFGMHLWYVCPVGAPVQVAIELYERAFENKGYADLPNPPYRSGYREENTFDVIYHVLKLYKTRVHRLSSVLNPATHTDDPLDYRLSWLLLQLFLSLDVGLIEDAEITKLCTSFSNQLESLGKWEWAIFVLLYLKDNALKRNLVTAILDRNLSAETDRKTLDSQSDLVNRMRLPPEWIHGVKAEKSLLLQRHFHAFNHFAHARNYGKANDVLVQHLLPGLFINEQYDVIRILIAAVEPGSGEILRWANDVALFSDFLSLQEDVITFRPEDLLKLQMRLQSIGDRVATFDARTDQQKLCVAEMSKRCASVYKELFRKSRTGLLGSSYSDFVEGLVMPPDYKQDEALFLIKESNNVMC
ncbi:nuclear pore complex protein Nup98-Nup96 [Anoplophora glabripennis]|uniref:nuclear pore complex protein Nup98-Nup96 n=1 Tax=Anoplophora glabripennis TaxID=217634 RepID=UPI00087418C6|nr:nuclear pore complex protein Nup98-Nup96 [Anoplophora glabripennis]